MPNKVLFEIPIYAMKKEDLLEKFEKKADRLRREKGYNESAIGIMTYPQCLWEYNHIVGFVRISAEHSDIIFDVFLPVPRIERYCWWSEKKKFLYNISANGTHFYVNDRMDNAEIAERINEMLDDVKQEDIPHRYFVDTRTFETTYLYLDYKKIMA